jgi:hypothetical protein
MRYFMIGMGILIGLLFLVAVLSNQAPASDGVRSTANATPPADGTLLVCLVLVVGTALLSGIVWLGTLQRIPAED